MARGTSLEEQQAISSQQAPVGSQAGAGAPPGDAPGGEGARLAGGGTPAEAGGVAVVGAPRTARRARVSRRGAAAPRPAATTTTRNPTAWVPEEPGERDVGEPGGAGEPADVGEPGGAGGAGVTEEGTGAARRAAGPEGRQRARLLRTRSGVALAALAVLGAAAAVVFGVQWSSLDGQAQSRAQVGAALHTFLVDFFDMAPKTISTWERSLLGVSTGAYAHQVKQVFGNGLLAELKAAQMVQQGTIWAAQVKAVHANTATASAVVDDRYDDTPLQSSGHGPQTDVLWVAVGLQRTSTGWKVASVKMENGNSALPASAKP